MLIYVWFGFRIDRLLQLERIIRHRSRQAIHPTLSKNFKSRRSFSVFHKHPIIERINIRHKNIDSYHACFNFIWQSRCENHDCIFQTTITRTITRAINISRNFGDKLASFKQIYYVGLYLFCCFGHITLIRVVLTFEELTFRQAALRCPPHHIPLLKHRRHSSFLHTQSRQCLSGIFWRVFLRNSPQFLLPLARS